MRLKGFLLLALLCGLIGGCATPDDKSRIRGGDPLPAFNAFKHELGGLRQSDVVADLAWERGAGAIQAAKYGLKSRFYADDIVSYISAKKRIREAGVSDKASVEWLNPRISLRDASIIFYAPSRQFGEADLGAALKDAKLPTKVFSTEPLGLVGAHVRFVGRASGFWVYSTERADIGVRDTVPPPRDDRRPAPPSEPMRATPPDLKPRY